MPAAAAVVTDAAPAAAARAVAAAVSAPVAARVEALVAAHAAAAAQVAAETAAKVMAAAQMEARSPAEANSPGADAEALATKGHLRRLGEQPLAWMMLPGLAAALGSAYSDLGLGIG